MKDLIVLFIPLMTTLAKLMEPSSAKAFVADSLLLKQRQFDITDTGEGLAADRKD